MFSVACMHAWYKTKGRYIHAATKNLDRGDLVKIRSTEKPHSFTEKLRRAIPIYDLQGLTLDSDNDFAAGVEAVEYDLDEEVENLFSLEEWKAKWNLCNHLSVPLYAVTYKTGDDFIEILEISFDNDEIETHDCGRFSFRQYANWWVSIKGTIQSKPLYEASSRISFFDNLLAKYGLAWGGNIDGFLLSSKMKPQAILETRYTTKTPLGSYDPAVYFRYRNGDYKTWEPLILLAKRLKIPLFLLTFERKSTRDCLGFSTIDSISREKLFYRNGPPFNNMIRGVANIRQQIRNKLSEAPPYIRSE